MLAVVFTAVLTFFIASLFGYVVHRSLHQPWAGRFYRAHMTHHIRLYPPTDYTSDKYRSPGKDNTVWIFAVAAMPLVAIPIILGIAGIMPTALVATSLVIMIVMSFLHSYLHDSFHIKKHWLHRMPVIGLLFSRWTHIHWLHHVDMRTNYGIFLFHWDHVFHTYWEE